MYVHRPIMETFSTFVTREHGRSASSPRPLSHRYLAQVAPLFAVDTRPQSKPDLISRTRSELGWRDARGGRDCGESGTEGVVGRWREREGAELYCRFPVFPSFLSFLAVKTTFSTGGSAMQHLSRLSDPSRLQERRAGLLPFRSCVRRQQQERPFLPS